jgi:hypothetical protein
MARGHAAMKKINTGGPAFPVPGLHGNSDYDGMDLRDYFAAKAMQGLIAHEERAKQLGSHNLGDFDVRVAVCAYRYADAMLEARGK